MHEYSMYICAYSTTGVFRISGLLAARSLKSLSAPGFITVRNKTPARFEKRSLSSHNPPLVLEVQWGSSEPTASSNREI